MIAYQLVKPGILLLGALLLRHLRRVLRRPLGMIGIHHRVVVEVPGDVDLQGTLHKQLLFCQLGNICDHAVLRALLTALGVVYLPAISQMDLGAKQEVGWLFTERAAHEGFWATNYNNHKYLFTSDTSEDVQGFLEQFLWRFLSFGVGDQVG